MIDLFPLTKYLTLEEVEKIHQEMLKMILFAALLTAQVLQEVVHEPSLS